MPHATSERPIGPGRVEIVRNRLIRLIRETRGPINREAHDFSRGLPALDGELVAKSEGNPLRIVPTMYSVPAVQERFGRSSPRP